MIYRDKHGTRIADPASNDFFREPRTQYSTESANWPDASMPASVPGMVRERHFVGRIFQTSQGTLLNSCSSTCNCVSVPSPTTKGGGSSLWETPPCQCCRIHSLGVPTLPCNVCGAKEKNHGRSRRFRTNGIAEYLSDRTTRPHHWEFRPRRGHIIEALCFGSFLA